MNTLAATLASFGLATGLAAQSMVGISFSGAITSVSAVTGTGTQIGSTGMTGHGGLARIDDVLWTHDSAGRLWRIDPWSGVATAGALTTPLLNSIRAMAADRRGQLYVIQNGGGPIGTSLDLLYVVEPRTGAATLLGTMSHNGIQALAFAPDNTLYGWDTTVGLVTVSPTTAVSTDVNAAVAGTASIQALTFGANGVLYGARNELYSISRSTGVTTLIGSGGYSDLRGLEYVHGPRIYDNGPLVTHPGGGFAGADLSMVQTSLGLTAGGWLVDVGLDAHVIDDFQTNGPWQVDAVEFFVWRFNGSLDVNDVRLAIYDNPPNAGGVEVSGSPGMQVNLMQQPGYLVTNTFTDIYRASQSTPFSTTARIQRIRVQFAAPLNLFSALLPSGRYWLRFACDAPQGNLAVVPVTTRGYLSPGNAVSYFNQQFTPMLDAGQSQAITFGFFGSGIAPPAAITNLGGGCGPATASLDVRGATVAGGAVLHEVVGNGGFPGLLIGVTDPSLSLAPSCGCVQHAAMDFFSFGSPTHAVVAPPGVGTGFQYYVQGLQIDFVGVNGLPCDLGIGFDFRLTDAYRVRFW